MAKITFFDWFGKKIDNAKFETIYAEAVSELAFRELALHIAISYIANTLSKCEFKTFENKKEVKDKLYYMLNVSPNPNENSSRFINKCIEQYYYNKDGALVIEQGGHIYCATDFTVDESDELKGFTYSDVTFGTKQLTKTFKAKDVFHLKLDNKSAKDLVDKLYEQYGKLISLAMQTFKRTNGKKYKLMLQEYRAGDPNFQKQYETVIKANLKEFIEKDNSIFPNYKGMDLVEFSTATPTNSADVIALRKEIFETTAQAFKIPLSMMYGNITNMNEIVKVYLSICIDPLADMIGEELTRKYFTFDEWKNGSYIKVDTSSINHIDIMEIGDKVDKLISSGFTNIDEVRKRCDLEELNTAFSKAHFITKNYDLAENMLKNSEKGGAE